MAVFSLILAAVLVGIDQLLKFVVTQRLLPVKSVTAIPGLLDFTYVENRGAAFGVMQNQRWLFVVATLLLIVAVVLMLFFYKNHTKLTYVCCALIIGGGIGNLIDRAFNGFVVDYIHVSFFPPVFNFADCCVVVGTILFAVYILFFSEKHAQKAGSLQGEEKPAEK